MKSSIQNTQEIQNKLRKLKVQFMFNSNRSENEGTKKHGFYRNWNKRDNGDIFSEERVLGNLLSAINYLEK